MTKDKSTEIFGEIVTSTQDVFSTMVMLDIQPLDGEDFDPDTVDANISSMLGLGGDIKGMVAVHCPDAVAKRITSSFLGTEVNEIDEDVKDALGEIANMVAGNLKIFFHAENISTELALPTTIIGRSYKTRGSSGATRIVVPFSCCDGVFLVELKYILSTVN